jgi:hypothetical protein
MNILQSPAEYACKLAELCSDYSSCEQLMFDAIRAHPLVPNCFWSSCLLAIVELYADK